MDDIGQHGHTEWSEVHLYFKELYILDVSKLFVGSDT